MKLLLLVTLFIFFAESLVAQGVERYETGTTVVLNNKISRYSFDFDGGKQGFYWAENYQIGMLSGFVFSIMNSSHDKITIQKVSKGNEIVEFRTHVELPSVVEPKDSLMVVAMVRSHEDHIDVPIIVHYTRNGLQDSLHISTWQNKVRTNKLRVYYNNRDISRTSKVHVMKNGNWDLADVIDTVPGYYFFKIQALQDSLVPVRIETRNYGTIESKVFTSRGAHGYVRIELAAPFRQYRPAGFGMKVISAKPNSYCLVTKKGRSILYSYWDEYLDSVQRIVNRFAVQSFDKSKMTLIINSKKTAYILDQRLRKSGLEAKLLPIYSHDKILPDKVTIFFTSGTSSEWIIKTFKELGIERYYKMTPRKVESNAYGKALKYDFYFDAVIGTLHQDQLEALWNMRQVKFLNQKLIRNPYLPDRLDSD